MDTNLQKAYDNYFALFRTEGWKQFIEDMESVYDGFHIEDIKDEQSLFKTQGELKILNNILCFENGIKANYEILTEK
mgnify:CR=1 FL=1